MNAVTIIRNLLTAGWRANSHTAMSDGSVVLDGTHPARGTITACVTPDDATTLILTGLTAEQVAAALTAVGHMPPVPVISRWPVTGWSPATRAAAKMLRQLDGADLGDVASGRTPLPPTREGQWRAASNGINEMRWFLIREAPGSAPEYHYGSGGRLVRYGSYEAAQLKADRLNRRQDSEGGAR